MSRLYWLFLTIVILGIFAAYMSWFTVSTSSDVHNDKANIDLTIDKGKVKEDAAAAKEKAQELGQKTRDEAQEVARKIERLTEKNTTRMEFDTHNVDIQRGTALDIVVNRSGDDLSRLQLGLVPSPGSNLLLSGGLFKAGETFSNISIEAPKDAKDGTITVVASGKAEIITITVKN